MMAIGTIMAIHFVCELHSLNETQRAVTLVVELVDDAQVTRQSETPINVEHDTMRGG